MQDDSATIFNAADAATTATSGTITIASGVNIGSIAIVTNSAFNGTTSTMALQGSNDNSNWAQVLQDDNATSMSFTLAAASSTYTFLLKAIFFKFYRLVYTKGDASAGTITANYTGKP